MSRTLRMPFVVLAVAAAVIVGLYVGSRLPWGGVPLTVETGVVTLDDDGTGYATFDGQDGTQLAFHVQSIAWTHGGQEGESGPPSCLREGKEVAAEVGYRSVRLPNGRAQAFPLWMSC